MVVKFRSYARIDGDQSLCRCVWSLQKFWRSCAVFSIHDFDKKDDLRLPGAGIKNNKRRIIYFHFISHFTTFATVAKICKAD